MSFPREAEEETMPSALGDSPEHGNWNAGSQKDPRDYLVLGLHCIKKKQKPEESDLQGPSGLELDSPGTSDWCFFPFLGPGKHIQVCVSSEAVNLYLKGNTKEFRLESLGLQTISIRLLYSNPMQNPYEQ